MQIGARVEISQDSQFSGQIESMGVGVIFRIDNSLEYPYYVRSETTGYENCYERSDLVIVPERDETPKKPNRYPVFKKGQRVRIISSTYQPHGDTRRLASKKRQGTIYRRRSRSRGREPSYDVSVVKAAYWGGRETYRYIFNASDLELWEKADG